MNKVADNIDIGKFVITTCSPIDTCTIYAGLTQYKPSCYFGIDFSEIIERHSLKEHSDYCDWFRGFEAAYSHYWKEPLGRMMAFDAPAVNRRSLNFHRMMDSIIPPSAHSETRGYGVDVGFYIPSVELYRRCTMLPIYEGGLSVSKPSRANKQAYYKLADVKNIPPELHGLLGVPNRQRGGFIWLSTFECQVLDLTIDSELFLWSHQSEICFSPKAPIILSTYEELSHSIDSAHLARLSALIGVGHRQPNNAGIFAMAALRALRAHRFKDLLTRIPRGTHIRHTLDGIRFRIDNAYLHQVFEAAYTSKLLPLFKCSDVDMNWNRDQSAFDVIFEARLNGRFNELNSWNTKAMLRGGINV